jgi:anaerobic selenocysteine-containing dehydrogenase
MAQKIKTLKDHLAQYTPDWAEKISGVPAKKIHDIAVEFANTQPACVISYRGAVAHYNGIDTERAIQMLAAITGNIDNPGGRCKAVGASWKYPKGPKKKPKARKLAIIDGFEGDSVLPTHHVSHQVLKMIKDGRAGRPEVYMWYCYAPVYANGEVQENIDVLKDETLIPYSVCVNPFYDESAALADLILPDATYLERWDWEDHVSPNQVAEYYIRQPVIKPMGEVRNFADVCCDLAKRMGFPLGFKSMEDFVKKSCRLTKASGGFSRLKKKGVHHNAKAKPKYYTYKKEVGTKALLADGVILDAATGVYWNWKKAKVESLEAAQAKGYTATKGAYKAYVGQKIGDKVYVGFKPDALNKSGFFEIYSDIMKDNDLPPLPTFAAVPEHAGLKSDELILTTYKVNVQIHSRSANCKWLSEIFHDNPAWINPATAEKLGIKNGAKVVATSAVGEIEVEARVTPAVVPGVIAISHHCGHWEYGRYASGKKSAAGHVEDKHDDLKWWTTNGVHPNWIIPNSSDPVAGQQRWMDTVVKVTLGPTA